MKWFQRLFEDNFQRRDRGLNTGESTKESRFQTLVMTSQTGDPCQFYRWYSHRHGLLSSGYMSLDKASTIIVGFACE
jgi:hypothetical protein